MQRPPSVTAFSLLAALSLPVAAQTAPTGTWRAVDILGEGTIPRMQPTLEFSGDGRVAGHGMCNRYFAVVTIADKNISVGTIGSTRMACSSGAMKGEAKYLAALASAETWRIDGAARLLELRNREGAVVLKFEPHP